MKIKELREMNLNSIDVLTRALQRLNELRPQIMNPSLRDEIEAEISTVELELRIATIVQTRLQAAAVIVNPLTQADQNRLDKLAQSIDDTIERDAVVNATLNKVLKFISTATEVRDLVKSSTSVS